MITTENKETVITIADSDSKFIIDSFYDGSFMTLFHANGIASVSISREETEALIAALQLTIS